MLGQAPVLEPGPELADDLLAVLVLGPVLGTPRNENTSPNSGSSKGGAVAETYTSISWPSLRGSRAHSRWDEHERAHKILASVIADGHRARAQDDHVHLLHAIVLMRRLLATRRTVDPRDRELL